MIDFDDPGRNELLVTRQFKVKGATKHVIADAVVFVNGLPLAVLELKNPTLGDAWLHDAVDQLTRYQEGSEGYRDLGAPQVFNTVQGSWRPCGLRAAYGTVGTPQRFFAEWKTPYPALEEEVAVALGKKPTPQDVALWGLFQPANLLDIVRNFVVYENDKKASRVIHKLPRYPQFLAVNKAIARIKGAKDPEDRGGVIWHTQGSGKSLTMLWLALKLRRDPAFEHPTIVIVTDRTDLDDQISGTFQAAGFPNPDRADSVRDLREKLAGPTGITLTTTIQKFQDLAAADGGRGAPPVLNGAENIFVMVDEAHRTQYRSLAANMRVALPWACFLGFTGTPIDRNDRSTKQTFGPYIDTYTIEQAVQDGATVPIFYESRLPKLHLIGASLDKLFDHVFSDRTKEERVEIKRKYATEAAIATAPKRIEAICLDLIEHYVSFIQPNGFKAQIVAVSREAAVVYKETLDRLNAPTSALIMSSTQRRRGPPGQVGHQRPAAQGADRAVQEAQGPAVDPGGLRHAHHGIRRAGGAGHVPRLPAEGAHAASGHRPGEPQGGGEDLRSGGGLLGRLRCAQGGAGDLLAPGREGGDEAARRRAAPAPSGR